MGQPSLGPEFFANMYAESSDPWNFAASAYERAKYAATLEALKGRHFRSAFEIGCSVGVLTAMLAPRCDRVLSIDVNERALDAARERCVHLPQVRFAQMTFPLEAPDEPFDAIVVSEVAYYWSDDDLARAIDWIAMGGAGGIVELVHFLPKVDEYVRDGDAVHAAFLSDPRFTPLHAERAERYRIDVLRAQ